MTRDLSNQPKQMKSLSTIIRNDDRIEFEPTSTSRGGDRISGTVFFDGEKVGLWESNFKGPSKFVRVEDESLKTQLKAYAESFGTVVVEMGGIEMEEEMDLGLFIESLVDLA